MYSKCQKGSAFIIVLIVLMVLSILGAAVLNRSLAETKQVIYQANKMKAYYTARSGADALASYLINHPEEAANIVNKTSSNHPGTGSINGNQFKITLQGSTPYNSLSITSTGTVNNVSSSVTLTMQSSPGDSFNDAIFTEEAPSLGNNLTVTGDTGTGDVGTNDTNAEFGNKKCKINGNLFLGSTTPDDKLDDTDITSHVTGSVEKLSAPVTFPDIDESKFTDYQGTLDSSRSFDVSMQERYIKVDSINLKGHDSINVTGNGVLNILVSDSGSISLQGSASINSADRNTRIFIYYNGANGISFGGTPNFYGLLYAPHADLNWNGTGNFYGSLISKSFSSGTGNCSVIYDSRLKSSDIAVIGNNYKRGKWSN